MDQIISDKEASDIFSAALSVFMEDRQGIFIELNQKRFLIYRKNQEIIIENGNGYADFDKDKIILKVVCEEDMN